MALTFCINTWIGHIALLLIDAPTDSRGFDTALTRGRHANHAYIAVEDNQTAHDILVEAISRDWIEQPATVRRDQLNPHQTRQVQRNAFEINPEVLKRIEEIQQANERGRARKRELDQPRSFGLGL